MRRALSLFVLLAACGGAQEAANSGGPADPSAPAPSEQELSAGDARAAAGHRGLLAIKEAIISALKIDLDKIVGGVEASESGFDAVGAILRGKELHCSGTLIDRKVVLTAAHCLRRMETTTRELIPPEQLSFSVGAELGRGKKIRVRSRKPHEKFPFVDPKYDVGVICLEREADGVDPIPLVGAALSNEELGQLRLEFHGFGYADGHHRLGAGERRRVTMSVTADGLRLTNKGPTRNTCRYDSGGPALRVRDGKRQVVAVTSNGDPRCKEYGHSTRVDLPEISEWIRSTASTLCK